MITQIAQQKATAYLSIFAILCNKALNLKKENGTDILLNLHKIGHSIIDKHCFLSDLSTLRSVVNIYSMYPPN